MKTFQMNLPGYDSSRDDTDELVRWVNAPSKKAAEFFAKRIGAENVEQISYHAEEGVDYYLNKEGKILKSSRLKLDPNRQWEADFEERCLSTKEK